MSDANELRDARTSYERDTLDEGRAAANPHDQFRAWLDAAVATKDLVEPNAVTVATVDADGRPSARVVLLRGHDARGFVFFTNYDSRKGRDLAVRPVAALLFFWPALERQIRIEGAVARLDDAESDAYFASRPRGHRVSAWASHQSAVIPDRAFVEARMEAEDARFADVEVPRPPYWGGYRVTPEIFEFWQGRRNRVHDRLSYRRDGERWRIERLSP